MGFNKTGDQTNREEHRPEYDLKGVLPFGIKGDGTASTMPLTPEGLQLNADLFFEIAKGNVTGHTTIEKFGEVSSVSTSSDPADVWDGGDVSGAELYTFSTTADIDSLSSSDDTDSQDILIQGLDTDWNEVNQTVTLNGQTPVSLSTNLIRVFRMVNMGSTDIAGVVYNFVSGGTVTAGVPQTVTDIRAIINNGNNQTLMCIYSVPSGKTGYFWGGYVSVSRGPSSSTFADFTWRARLFGGVFAVKSRIATMSNGRSSWDYTYKVPLALPEKTDVLIRVEQVGATLGASGGFTVVLIDN